MGIETELELQSFYPANLEVANICQTVKSRLKCLPAQKAVHVLNAALFQNIGMGPMNEKFRTFPSLVKRSSFW